MAIAGNWWLEALVSRFQGYCLLSQKRRAADETVRVGHGPQKITSHCQVPGLRQEMCSLGQAGMLSNRSFPEEDGMQSEAFGFRQDLDPGE